MSFPSWGHRLAPRQVHTIAAGVVNLGVVLFEDPFEGPAQDTAWHCFDIHSPHRSFVKEEELLLTLEESPVCH
jgi:hypothetical protein